MNQRCSNPFCHICGPVSGRVVVKDCGSPGCAVCRGMKNWADAKNAEHEMDRTTSFRQIVESTLERAKDVATRVLDGDHRRRFAGAV